MLNFKLNTRLRRQSAVFDLGFFLEEHGFIGFVLVLHLEWILDEANAALGIACILGGKTF